MSTDKELVATKQSDSPEPTDGPADFSTDGPPIFGRDVKDIPKRKNKNEHFQLTGESWVIIGEGDNTPDWAVGKPAAVTWFPTAVKLGSDNQVLYHYTDPDAIITVRERSQGATLSVKLSDCWEVHPIGGRGQVVNHP